MSALYRQGISVENKEEIQVLKYSPDNFREVLEKATELRRSGQNVSMQME